MNLLILIHSLHTGGAERVTANLANHWVGRGWQVTVVTLASRVQDFYDLHPAVRRIALDLAGESRNPLVAVRNNLRRIFALRRVLHEMRPDVSVGMMNSAGVLLVMAALRLPKCATIVSERTYPPMLLLGPMWRRLRRWTYPLANKVTMLTTEGLAWLKEEIPRARGVMIPNAIPFPLPMSEPRLMPDSVIKPGRRLLLTVGRLSEEKRFDLLLKVFTSLSPANPDWDLAILGEGPLRQALESQVRASGLQGRALLPGRVGNVGDWYRRADLYAMSSRFEGFPNTLGEAMAHGCAAVSFDCDTGPRDIIRHEVDGLLVAAGDASALEKALRRMMIDEPLRQQFAARAIEVRERFSLERVAGMWEQLFEDVRR